MAKARRTSSERVWAVTSRRVHREAAVKILLYEWCCSGGLAGGDVRGELAGIVAEGRAMLEVLAADASRDETLDATVLVDAAQALTLPDGVRTRPVPPDGEIDALVAAARDADWTVIVAPETDDILRSRVAAVRSAGGRVLNASDAFIAIAADKQATVNALAAAGVPADCVQLVDTPATWGSSSSSSTPACIRSTRTTRRSPP